MYQLKLNRYTTLRTNANVFLINQNIDYANKLMLAEAQGTVLFDLFLF